MPFPLLPILGAGAAALFFLQRDKDKAAEAARTRPPPPMVPVTLIPGASAFLPYFQPYAATVPTEIIYQAANVLQAKNPEAAGTIARNAELLGHPAIAAIIRNAMAGWGVSPVNPETGLPGWPITRTSGDVEHFEAESLTGWAEAIGLVEPSGGINVYAGGASPLMRSPRSRAQVRRTVRSC
jgi:hypothetical protein